MVIFPQQMTPFIVGREASVRALEEALAGDKKIFLSHALSDRPPTRHRCVERKSSCRPRALLPARRTLALRPTINGVNLLRENDMSRTGIIGTRFISCFSRPKHAGPWTS